MPTEEMIVLASSRKMSARCVAGISTRSREWVRPVSRLSGGLRQFQCRVDGRWPQLLDLVSFEYSKRCDDPAQPENLLIEEAEWRLVDCIDPGDAYAELREHLQEGPELLGNRGKAVTEEIAEEGVEASLALIEPSGPVSFVMRPPGETYGKLKPRVVFDLDGEEYELGLTDIEMEAAVRQAGVGSYDTADLGFGNPAKTLLTISLGEAYRGWHTKLVAAVLFVP